MKAIPYLLEGIFGPSPYFLGLENAAKIESFKIDIFEASNPNLHPPMVIGPYFTERSSAHSSLPMQELYYGIYLLGYPIYIGPDAQNGNYTRIYPFKKLIQVTHDWVDSTTGLLQWPLRWVS
jgi:hypothetical protein